MEKIKELLLLEDKTELHKQLPRLKSLEKDYKKKVTDIFEIGGNATELRNVLHPFFETEELHKQVIEILEPK